MSSQKFFTKDDKVRPISPKAGEEYKDADLRIYAQHQGIKEVEPIGKSITSGNRLIIIGGPLGAGKTELMRRLAKSLDVNIDEPGHIHSNDGVAIVGDYYKTQSGTDTLTQKKRFWSIIHDLIGKKKIILAEGAYVGKPGGRDRHDVIKARTLLKEHNYTPVIVHLNVPKSVYIKRFFEKGTKPIVTDAGTFTPRERHANVSNLVKRSETAVNDNKKLAVLIGAVSKEVSGNRTAEQVSHSVKETFNL